MSASWIQKTSAVLHAPAGFAAAFAMFLLTGCTSGGVGDPCVPEDEYNTGFSNYSRSEVNIESRSFQCDTRLCLVAKFQGRVSCPFGQDAPTPEEINTKSACQADNPSEQDVADARAYWGANRCRIPGTDGSCKNDRVTTKVDSQLVARRPTNAVYCSCRCADADGKKDNGVFCDCPETFSCEKLRDSLLPGNEQLDGYYCIKSDSKDTTAPPRTCKDNPDECPDGGACQVTPSAGACSP